MTNTQNKEIYTLTNKDFIKFLYNKKFDELHNYHFIYNEANQTYTVYHRKEEKYLYDIYKVAGLTKDFNIKRINKEEYKIIYKNSNNQSKTIGTYLYCIEYPNAKSIIADYISEHFEIETGFCYWSKINLMKEYEKRLNQSK